MVSPCFLLSPSLYAVLTRPRPILGAGEVQTRIPEIFSKISGGAACLEVILGSDPDLQESVDWDSDETLRKVRASPEDVIKKAMYPEHQIIYSKDRTENSLF